MDQKDLEYFVKVADSGSVSQAAIQLGIAQPVISRHIRALERDLHTRLLHRTGRGVVLAEAGERLYRRAAIILEQMAQARAEALSVQRKGIQNAKIGLLPSLARMLAVPIARELLIAYPKIQLQLIEGMNGHLLEWLSNCRLDVAVIYSTEAAHRLYSEDLLNEPLYAVGTLKRSLPRTIDAKTLSKLPLILPSRVHGLRQQIESWAYRNRIELLIRVECDSFSALTQLIKAGVGYAILPRAPLKEEIELRVLTCSQILGLERRLSIASPPNKRNISDVSELTTRLKSIVRELQTDIGCVVKFDERDHRGPEKRMHIEEYSTLQDRV
jgi:LysR family nitrogen assimilation transcriptional regulator